MKSLSIVNANNNLTFNVVIIEKGEKYGLNDCLIADYTLIEFYDDRFKHTKHGQFVSRYTVQTLKDYNTFYGLRLHCGSDDWYVTHYNMQQIKQFLINVK